MSDELNTAASNNDKHHCIVAWQSLIELLHKLKSFRVNTGNINNYVELKQHGFNNSAEELCACLKLQFSNLPEDTQIGENETLLLADKKHRDALYDRDDLKITLKLFVRDFNYDSVRDSILSTMDELKIDRIEQLIIAFPQPGEVLSSTNHLPTKPYRNGTINHINDNTQEKKNFVSFDADWFANVLRLWEKVDEEFVSTQKVFSMGVADFHLEALKALYEASRVKPCVDHFNFSKCCVLSLELQTFAREHDIQLLTHNDPHPFPLKDVFHSFCNCSKDEQENRCSLFEPTWAARYTIWVRRRSLMAAKGYIVQFRSMNANLAKRFNDKK